MTNTSDIVERLRDTIYGACDMNRMPLCIEAADTIQALRAQVEELQARAAFVISDLAILANRHICEHEETYRGGAIWEICSACGQKWADDRGGKPKFTALMDYCGNDAPVLWMLHRRGYDLGSLRKLESETEKQNRLLREENAALRRVLQGHL